MGEKEKLVATSKIILDFIDSIAAESEAKRSLFGRFRSVIDGPLALGQALQVSSDLLEWASGLNRQQQDELGNQLVAKGLPRLSVLIATSYKRVHRVLGRKRLKSEEEYRLLSGILTNVEQEVLDEREVNLANTLLHAWESREQK